MTDPLDKFGKLVVTALRESAINSFDMAAKGLWKAPSMQNLQRDLKTLSPEQRGIVRRCVIDAVDNGMHDFLFALQEAHDNNEGIEVIVDGQNVVALSDGLHGEQFTDEGWIARFGKYPEGTGDPRDE